MLSFLIITVSVVLCVLRCLPLTGKRAVAAAWAACLACVGGIPPVVMALRWAKQLEISALDEAGWAWDMLQGWFSLAGGFTALVGIPLLIAALIRHKMVWMRTLIGPVAVILLQIGGAGYAVLCENTAVDLSRILTAFAAGCGAFLLCGIAADGVRYAVTGQPVLLQAKPEPQKPVRQHRRRKKRR
jgi:hypothetical protein